MNKKEAADYLGVTDTLKIYRELVEKNPEVFRPDVARTLNNLGVFHSAENHREEALKAFREALKIYEDLVKRVSPAYSSDVERVKKLIESLT